jgi:hypothetical protein
MERVHLELRLIMVDETLPGRFRRKPQISREHVEFLKVSRSICLEATPGIEPGYTDLQSAA